MLIPAPKEVVRPKQDVKSEQYINEQRKGEKETKINLIVKFKYYQRRSASLEKQTRTHSHLFESDS